MNFGMTNASSSFVTLKYSVFWPLIRKSVVIYLDNIIVFSKSIAQHKLDLRNVLNILCDNQLYAKPSKCQFYEKSLKFLRHIISTRGIKPDPEKIKAIVELPRPTNILGLQSFLGLVAFVRKFIPNCSELIAPLTALLKKGVKFEWNFEREKNFEELKKRLTSAPLLQYPDPQKPYQLETDASDLAIGAVLRILTSEGYKPVAYKSRMLLKSEQITQSMTRSCLQLTLLSINGGATWKGSSI